MNSILVDLVGLSIIYIILYLQDTRGNNRIGATNVHSIPSSSTNNDGNSAINSGNDEQEGRNKKRAGLSVPDVMQMLPYKPKLRPRKKINWTNFFQFGYLYRF